MARASRGAERTPAEDVHDRLLGRLLAGEDVELDRTPWAITKGNVSKDEREMRRRQLLTTTARIQPTTSRGVAYRLVNFGIIGSKDQFRAVVDLVRNMRDNDEMPFDWITDEGRPLWLPYPDRDVGDFIGKVKGGFYFDAWAEANVQVVICVEKLALHGVFLPVAQEFGVPICSTRGFNSITKLKEIARHIGRDKRPIIVVNLGDHDPSGVTVMMSTHATLWRYTGGREIVSHRLAVLPEHFARFGLLKRMMDVDDSEHGKHVKAKLDGRDILYEEKRGSGKIIRLRNAIGNRKPIYDASLGVADLDAIDPNEARALLRRFLLRHLPTGARERHQERQATGEAMIDKLSENWPEVEAFLATLPD